MYVLDAEKGGFDKVQSPPDVVARASPAAGGGTG